MMKVAYVVPYLQRASGWRNHAIALVEAMRAYVEPVLVVAVDDAEAAQALFPGDRVIKLPVTQQASFSNRRSLYALANCLRAIRWGRFPAVDLVHSLEAYPTGLVGSWLADKLQVPHVLTVHGTYGVIWAERRLDRAAYCQVLKTAQRICPVSHGTAQLMQAHFADVLAPDGAAAPVSGPGRIGERLHPILNGNMYVDAVPATTALERVFPPLTSEAAPIVLSVGDIKPRKGQHISLAAFARVQAEIPQAQYWLVGKYQPESAYFQRMQALVSQHDLKNVHFRGIVSDAELRAAYESAAVFVLTPQMDGLHFEGFGLVYLEAGAYGLPVVGTRSGGVPDAVRDGETGILAEPQDVEGVANAILALLRDPERSRRMGLANRAWAEQLTWQRTAQEQWAVYQEISP